MSVFDTCQCSEREEKEGEKRADTIIRSENRSPENALTRVGGDRGEDDMQTGAIKRHITRDWAQRNGV